MSEFLKPNETKGISRRAVMFGMFGAGLSMLTGGCGGENNNSKAYSAPKRQDPEVCILSYPGATVLNIVGNDPYRKVRVDQNNNGTFDYEGVAGVAPSLQYNEGPIGLDDKPLWEEPIRDKVCY